MAPTGALMHVAMPASEQTSAAIAMPLVGGDGGYGAYPGYIGAAYPCGGAAYPCGIGWPLTG
ncbi:hypothetical protein Phou_045960 [Phytohabitans houttuyneae]|uniref:Uncharacterized protein n=1 Tax=Phytohabitans houttuyneae TaxID=1076126 RepID=A0A6V8KEG0_9ACTN|nr:hypothetical protein Phou_045960 [Phytohabitans houttuyneae]